jgi:hypothetical protein
MPLLKIYFEGEILLSPSEAYFLSINSIGNFFTKRKGS